MLSRSAQGLYWMGRYAERTERLASLLQAQTEALVDRPVRDIHAGWRRIYGALQTEPPGGLVLTESEDFAMADSYTLAGDLTFERANPASLWSCFSSLRENARQMRHLITSEMWLRVNLGYLRIRDLDIEDIWRSLPEQFYAGVIAEIDGFSGAAAATMYRDEGWLFFHLGRFVERAQVAPALLLEQIAVDADEGEPVDADWGVLLRVFHAVEAYTRRNGAAVQSAPALDLLVADAQLPCSLTHALHEIKAALDELGPAPGVASGAAAHRTAGRLVAALAYDWQEEDDRGAFLQHAVEQCRSLHFLIAGAYFDYPA